MTVISINNSKGGTGKTTTAVNLSASLAMRGRRVLLIDLDSQSASTTHLGFNFRYTDHVATIYESLVSKRDLTEAVLPTPVKNLFLVPSNINLSATQVELFYIEDREHVLKQALGDVADQYDMIVLDCAPSVSTLLIAALVSADLTIIPIQPEFFSLSGLASLLEVIEMVEERVHMKIDYRVLFTMYDRRLRLTREVEDHLTQRFGDRLFKTQIPRNIRVAEAPSHGMPIVLYDPMCKGAMAYDKLAEEVLAIGS